MRQVEHLRQANLNVAVDMHLTTDVHVMLWVCEGHDEGWQSSCMS